MFGNEISIEYQEAAVDAVMQGEKGIGERRLAAERAVDGVLSDSFPASDPPSWTLGVTHPQIKRQATNADGRTFLDGLSSLAGSASIALLVPLVILVIGTQSLLPFAVSKRAAGCWR